MAIVFEEEIQVSTKIKVIGLGGGGGNAVSSLVGKRFPQVELIIANTDAQVLKSSPVSQKIQLGCKITRGRGAGSDPEIGKNAALEDRERIREALEEADIVFIAAGLGGGTGTGASPIVARVARNLGALTIAVVTLPFTYEGKKRMLVAKAGLKELKPEVDILIAIPNQRLLELGKEGDSIIDTFKLANNILYQRMSALSDLISIPGLVNVDFADIQAIMKSGEEAFLGFGEVPSEEGVLAAIQLALANPLLGEKSIRGAKGVLVNIIGPKALPLDEVKQAINIACQEVDADAQIVFGAVPNGRFNGRIKATIIAAGLEKQEEKQTVGTVDIEAFISKGSSGFGNGENKGYLDIPAFLRQKKQLE